VKVDFVTVKFWLHLPRALVLGLALGVGSAWGQSPFTVHREPGSGLSFVFLPPGRFLMGSPTGEPERGRDEGQHLVVLSRGIWMGQLEVTRAQWERVMGGMERHPGKPNPFAGGDSQLPVVAVSYRDIQGYFDRLQTLAPGQRFRLPTEAEWEYACRAGTSTAFHGGPALDASRANIDARFPYGKGSPGPVLDRPTPVGSYPPNAWGLYDFHGNVWEWTSDWYGPYSSSSVLDPRGPVRGTRKVIRGGSWAFSASSARSAARYQHAPGDWGYSLGFRVVWEPGPGAEPQPKKSHLGP
jgi:formylglycine-generating enzyme required for sulfatase activity